MSHKHSFKDLSDTRKQLVITEISEESLNTAEKEVLKQLSKEMNIKGFRPGKIPESVVREKAGEDYLKMQSIQQALPDVANQLVADAKYKVVGQPSINFESIDPLKIVVEFDIYPEVKVGDYKKVKVKVDKKTASDKEVNEVIETLQKRVAEYVEVDRKAKMGDRVEMDFDGVDKEGVAIQGASSKNYPLLLGSNMLIPGFEEELVGLKAGEEKSFDITFPKDYHEKKLAGEKATFKVKVHKVEETKLPEITDDFVEKMTGEKQSAADWKKSLKEQIQKEHDAEVKRQVEEEFYKELIKLTKGEIPASMIEAESQQILKELKQQILQQGLSYEHYLQSLKKTEEELLKDYEQQANDRIKLRLALQKIREEEKIEISDEDVQEQLKKMTANHSKEDAESVLKGYKPGTEHFEMLRYQLGMQKTLEKILPEV